jgi:hypothetical protein
VIVLQATEHVDDWIALAQLLESQMRWGSAAVAAGGVI